MVRLELVLQVCHIGDALAPEASIEGGFAGLVVDLYSDGKVLSQLDEVCILITVLCFAIAGRCLGKFPLSCFITDSAMEW